LAAEFNPATDKVDKMILEKVIGEQKLSPKTKEKNPSSKTKEKHSPLKETYSLHKQSPSLSASGQKGTCDRDANDFGERLL
jgi:hypothetical protein